MDSGLPSKTDTRQKNAETAIPTYVQRLLDKNLPTEQEVEVLYREYRAFFKGRLPMHYESVETVGCGLSDTHDILVELADPTKVDKREALSLITTLRDIVVRDHHRRKALSKDKVLP